MNHPLPLLLLFTLLTGCASSSHPPLAAGAETLPPETLEARSLGSIARLHALGGVFLASQPSEADFEALAASGVRTVVNLRVPSELGDFDEGAWVRELGLEYVSVPIAGAAGLDDGAFERVRETLSAAERPLFLHCASANRVGAVWIPWRVLDGGLDLEVAVSEAREIGLRSQELEQKARDYVARRQAAR